MLTARDLHEIRERAHRLLVNAAPRCRLEGMNTDLTPSDIQLLAFYEASLTHANSKLGENRLNNAELDAVFPKTYQRVQETITGEETMFNLKAQG